MTADVICRWDWCAHPEHVDDLLEDVETGALSALGAHPQPCLVVNGIAICRDCIVATGELLIAMTEAHNERLEAQVERYRAVEVAQELIAGEQGGS